jgi:hypothetical protein
MNTSMQAAGGRHLAPAVPGYPFRCLVWECHDGDLGPFWKLAEVFEMPTLEMAELYGLDACTEPYPIGVTAMHYVIGEVDHG